MEHVGKRTERATRSSLVDKLGRATAELTELSFETKPITQGTRLELAYEARLRLMGLTERSIDAEAEVTLRLGAGDLIRMRSRWHLRVSLAQTVSPSDVEADPGALLVPIAGRTVILFGALTREHFQDAPLLVNPALLTKPDHVKCEWSTADAAEQSSSATPS